MPAAFLKKRLVDIAVRTVLRPAPSVIQKPGVLSHHRRQCGCDCRTAAHSPLAVAGDCSRLAAMLPHKVQYLVRLLPAKQSHPILPAFDVVELQAQNAPALRRLRQRDDRLIWVLNRDQYIILCKTALACLALGQCHELPARCIQSIRFLRLRVFVYLQASL